MRAAVVTALGALALIGLMVEPSVAVTTRAFDCDAGNEGLTLVCSGDVIVDANTVTLSFDTFTDHGSQIDSIGIQLPGSAAYDTTTTDTLNPVYKSADVGNLFFEAEMECTASNCHPSFGQGDTPFSLIFAYTGTAFTADDVVGPDNQTGTCDGFHGTLWGCLHVFRFDTQTQIATSEFVPLKATGSPNPVPTAVPVPPSLVLIAVGLFSLGYLGRRTYTRS
jgi:hypothetical protein